MSEASTRGSRGRRGRGGIPRSSQVGESGSSETISKNAAPSVDSNQDEESELKDLKQKYGGSDKLGLISQIFSDWTDQDILYTLKDANGDVETAIHRISEGQAHQWGAVKAKKVKPVASLPREQASPSPAAYNNVTNGPVRGLSRGRGEARGRGTRGGRGGRGGAPFSSRQSVPSVPVESSTVDDNGWADSAQDGPKDDAASTTATVGNDTQVGTPSTSVWDQQPASEKKQAPSPWGQPSAAAVAPVSQAAAAPAAPAVNGTIDQQQSKQPKLSAKAAAKRPVAGSAISWAQIAKPQEAAKPAPVQQPAPAQIQIPSQSSLQNAQAKEYTQSFESRDDVISPTHSKPAHDPWASTPAAASANNYPSAPLGVGEGWAETVLSNNGDEVSMNQAAYHHAAGSPDLQTAMPPSGIDPAGPIEIQSEAEQHMVTQQAPASLDKPIQSYAAPVAAQLEAQVEQQDQAKQYIDAPPGFGKQQQQSSGSPHLSREQASAQGNVDRVGVQFGSLGLFDPNSQQASDVQQQQQQQQPNAYAQQAQANAQAQQAQYDQERFTYPAQQPQQSSDRYAAATSQAAQSIPNAAAYQQAYGYQMQPASQQQQQDFSQAYLQHYQQAQQLQGQAARPPQPADAANSAYGSSSGTPANAPAPSQSPYATMTEQQAAYYAAAAQQQATAGYNYGSAYGAIPGQQQAGQDYSSVYGMPQMHQNEALRNLYAGYYTDQQAQQAQQSAYQRPSSQSADDSSKQSANGTPHPQLPAAAQYNQFYGYPYAQYAYQQPYGTYNPRAQQMQQMNGYRGQVYGQPQQQAYYPQASSGAGYRQQSQGSNDPSAFKSFNDF